MILILFISLLKRTKTITLDFDWVYRKGAKVVYTSLDKGLNTLNAAVDKVVIQKTIPYVSTSVQQLPLHILLKGHYLMSKLSGTSTITIDKNQKELIAKFNSGSLPIAASALTVMIVLGLVLIL